MAASVLPPGAALLGPRGSVLGTLGAVSCTGATGGGETQVSGKTLESMECVHELRGPVWWLEYSNVGKLDVCGCTVESLLGTQALQRHWTRRETGRG